MSLPATFASKTAQSTCTVWVGATNSRGYGLLYLNGCATLAHRIAYEAEHGPIPDGIVIDHLCRVRNCVRVDHLEAVTTAENNRRGRVAGGLKVGDVCINGHELPDADAIYTSPSGYTECRVCRRSGGRHSAGRLRPSIRKKAADIALVHTTT